MNDETILNHSKKINNRQRIIISWQKGDTITRLFMVLFFTGYIIPWIFYLLWGINYPFEIFFCFSFIWMTTPMFIPVHIQASTHNDVMKEYMKIGMESNNQYYLELTEYIDKYCKNGRIPGQIGYGIFSWAMYYVAHMSSILLGQATLPLVGVFTPFLTLFVIGVPILIILWFAGTKINDRLYDDAEKRGYHLRELRDAGLS